MDIYCTRCGEPWELDFIHDRVDELKIDGDTVDGKVPTFDVVRADFARRGCIALGGGQCERKPSLRTEAMAAMFDILGDDVDGAASMMEDLEYMGLLDEDGEL